MRQAAVAVILVALACLTLVVQAPQAQTLSGIVISEVYYHSSDDWVELYNRGSESVSLADWTLETGGGVSSQLVPLPDTIAPGQFLVVTVPGLTDDGNYLFLRQPGGTPSDAMSYGSSTACCSGLAAEVGHSLQLADLGAVPATCEYISAPPSPAQALPTPTPSSSPTPRIPNGALLLTEVFYQGDCDREWVEVMNASDASLSLTGLHLLDNNGTQPLSGEIAAGGVVVVQGASLQATPGCGGSLITADTACLAIRLADTGDYLQLGDGTRVFDSLAYGTSTPGAVAVAPVGQSLARLRRPDGTLEPWSASTPGPGCLQPVPTPTSTPTVTATPTTTPTPTATVPVGSVALTEVNYQGGCEREWVEVTNLGESTAALNGWRIGDNTGSALLQTILAPGEVLMIVPTVSSVVPSCGGGVYRVPGSCLGNGLADTGDVVWLSDVAGTEHDRMSYGDATGQPSTPTAPDGQSLARMLTDSGSLSAWGPADPGPGCLSSATPTPTPTPVVPPSPTSTPSTTVTPGPWPQALRSLYLPVIASEAAPALVPALLISEVLYQGIVGNQGDEFVEIRNATDVAVSLEGHKLGDAEYAGDGEGMYAFPLGAAVPARGVVVIARCAGDFVGRFGRLPDFELVPGSCSDSGDVPNMLRYTAWGGGSFSLADAGDEVLLLGTGDEIVDSAAFGSGQYRLVGLEGSAVAASPLSIHRVGTADRDDMSLDFGHEGPSPGLALDPSASPIPADGPSWHGYRAYMGDLHAHTSYSDGAGPPELAYARARQAGLHFLALTDHGYMLRENEWSALRSVANDATVPGGFLALAGFEWTHSSEGHIVVLGTKDLATKDGPETADVASLRSWLAAHEGSLGIVAHPGLGGTYPGQRPASEGSSTLLLQEVLNGSGTGGRVFQEELLTAWRNGWHVFPTSGSDTHDWLWGSGSTTRTGVWADDLTEQSLLGALAAGRVFASQDSDAIIGWSCGDSWMGSTTGTPYDDCAAFYRDGQGEGALLELLNFDGRVLQTWAVASGQESRFVPSEPDRFWLRVTQDDGDRAWTPPIWFLH